jgi:BarA-like signal transduction histidine kinase
MGEAPKHAKTEIAIVFDDSDLVGVKFPHDDPLVTSPMIGNSRVKRVPVDSGASVDILFHDVFLKMGYNDSQLTPLTVRIYEFNSVESKVEGTILLPMTMGQEPKEATQMLKFLVVKAATTYNAILGRTGLHLFKAVASTYHLKVKFPTRNRVGEERGDQKLARSCYIEALKPNMTGGQVLPVKDMTGGQVLPVEDMTGGRSSRLKT